MADQYFGALETIHNLIHNYSGGASPYPVGPNNEFSTGDMVDPGRTAQDPIFWSHHCMVDRAWYLWQIQPSNANFVWDPRQLGTALSVPGTTFTVADILDITKLGYGYASVEVAATQEG